MKKGKVSGHSILWAPWRKGYILRAYKMKTCIFCAALRERKDKKNFIVRRSKHAFAILNLYPYNNGHVMIVPNRHSDRFQGLRDDELLDLMHLQNEVLSLLEKKIKPHGINLGVNLGRTAGAGIAGHLHIHIVPRWTGDTNFMPLIGRVKVISESLSSLYARLTE